MHRIAALLLTPALLLFSCQGNNSDHKNESDTKTPDTAAVPITDDTDPLLLKKLDSVPLPQVKDTAGMDETGKDSLYFAWLFQKEANRLGRAETGRDYQTLASFAPEGVLKKFGGRNQYISRLKAADENREPYEKILNGPVKRVAPAVDEEGFSGAWYCLMPVRAYRQVEGREVVDMMWLGGQADLGSKKVVFLNVTNLSREQIMQVMPDLRFVLDAESGR